jgi:hypothetical protein
VEDAAVPIALDGACRSQRSRIDDEQFRAPGSEEEPSDGSEHSGDGSWLPACGRIATEHECFERHGDEADRHHDDEVPERTGRTSHPEMVDP